MLRSLALLLSLLCLPLYAQSKVSYVCSACVTGTNTKLTSMHVGQSFDLVLSCQDLRPTGTYTDSSGATRPLVRGVFASYCDVLYDKTLAKVTFADPAHPEWFQGCFTFANAYSNGVHAGDAPDRIDDVGGFAGPGVSFGSNTSPVEVWRVRMTAKAQGGLVFTPSLATLVHPMYDTLVYGNNLATPPEPSYVYPSEVVLIPCAVAVSP